MKSRAEMRDFTLAYALGKIQDKCMSHCLDSNRDEPGSAYAIHNSIRELWISECQRSSIDANREAAAIAAAMHGPRICGRMRMLRKRGYEYSATWTRILKEAGYA